MRSKKQILLVWLVLLAAAGSAHGQLSGANVKGDNGLNSGSQAPPGTYLTNLTYLYHASEIKLPNRTVRLAGGINISINVTAISRVTRKKFLGAYYGVQLAIPVAKNRIELPRLDTDDSALGISDLYVMPLQLGWHKKRADFIAAYAFSAPTGRFSPGGDNNTGLGMWTHEISGGTTVFLDQKRSWNLSTLAAYELHHKKQGIDIKVGDILTLEGGLGKTFLTGRLNVGAVYYAQWKVTADSGADLPRLLQRFGLDNVKHRAYAIGPEMSLLMPGLDSQVTLRALKEFGNSTATQGYAVVAGFTFFVDRPFRAMRKAQQAAQQAAPPAEPAKQP